jgi:hypothetical protein
LVQPGDFEYLPDETGQTADSELSTLILQLLGDSNERTQAHAADITKIAQIDDKARRAL